MTDLAPIPADIMAAQQEARESIVDSLEKLLVLARDLGATDDLLWGLIGVLQSEDVLLVDEAKVGDLVRKLNLSGVK